MRQARPSGSTHTRVSAIPLARVWTIPLVRGRRHPLQGVQDQPQDALWTRFINLKKEGERIMMEFDIDSRVQPIGKREGQTVYFARLKSQQKLTNDMVIERIVRETSLSP